MAIEPKHGMRLMASGVQGLIQYVCMRFTDNTLAVVSDPTLCVLVSHSNLRILQKSVLSTSASVEQWQEKALCLGSAGSCGAMLVGHIFGFGEDELGQCCSDETFTQLLKFLVFSLFL